MPLVAFVHRRPVSEKRYADRVPLILEIRCRSCAYRHQASERVILVSMGEGADEICRHPLEHDDAKRLTGLEFSELARRKRLHGGSPALCGRCGDVEYHRSLVPRRRSEALWAQGLVCRSCKKLGLHALETPSGEPPGGVLTAIILVVATIYTLLAGEPGMTIIPVVLLAALVLWWRRRGRRARARQAEEMRCPQCGNAGLSVQAIGIS